MARVTYDSRSLMIDGRRIWLISGSVHYFRLPSPLWGDALLKARRNGLNCIETYVAWNLHEPAEGQWDFSGDRDISSFIRQAQELGLYVILRPGPFIGAEWDFGGLPAWLTTKPGIQYRADNAAWLHYAGKYLRQVLPRLAELQVSRGGSIVAVQNENEYALTAMPDRRRYLGFLAQTIRACGFDVPMLTNNRLSRPLLDEAIECVSGWEDSLLQIKRLRQLQPQAPSIVVEYRCGQPDAWGRSHRVRDARAVARGSLEMLGAGAQVNHYMFHGGTNFGFWAGRRGCASGSFCTTSYDCDAPVAEGGALTEKYYLLRLVNVLAESFAGVLAAASPLTGAHTVNALTSFSLAGPQGRVTVVTNNGDESIATAQLVLHDGRCLEVDLSALGALAVFSDVFLTSQHTLNHSSLMPLGFFGGRLLVLHGRAGQEGVVSINEQSIAVTVPAAAAPAIVEHEGLTLVLMPSALAQRTWWVDGRLVIGADFVGESAREIVPAARAKQYWTLTIDGKSAGRLVPVRLGGKAPAKARPPKLSSWVRVAGSAELTDPDLRSWQKLAKPQDLARLGTPYGYGWYELRLELPRAAKKALFLPQCDDRATIWANGRRVGMWGRCEGALREPLNVELRRGANTLTFLTDNLGRLCGTLAMGEPKGLWGEVYAASPVKLRAWRIRRGQQDARTDRLVPRLLQESMKDLRRRPLHVAQTQFALNEPMPVHLRFDGLGTLPVALLCNDRLAAFSSEHTGGFGEAWMVSEVVAGVNQLSVLAWGELDAARLAELHLYRMEENLSSVGAWRFCPWRPPGVAGGPADVPTGVPAWFAARFRCPPEDSPPLFLIVEGAWKGQLYVNGLNAGRFWSVGPQKACYLPSPWLKEDNELLLFDEAGQSPAGSKLAFLPDGPYAV